LSNLKNPALAAPKTAIGEQDAEGYSGFEEGNDAGQRKIDAIKAKASGIKAALTGGS
jgi:hypothetical protein